MADNIKIVGEIVNIEQKSRYDEADLNLLNPFNLKKDFGLPKDYIEYFVYDAGGNLLNISYNYIDFKLPSTSYVDPISGSLPIIEIDPVKDLQNLGYTSGEFVTQYNFFNNRISDPSAQLFLKEISADRTEISVSSTTLTNEQLESATLSLINEYSGSAYFVDYLINLGNNIQVVAVNVALNKLESGYEILFKLYQPLPDDIDEKVNLWVVEEKVNPYLFDINLDKLIIPTPGPQLRGPNFDIEIPNQNNIGTSYQNYNNLINSLQNVSSSYQQLLSLITSQSIDINTDYTNFNNFIFFSSAKARVTNFYNKVKEIEDLNNTIISYIPLTSSYPNLINDYNVATASINNIISNFDGFEYYLYFENTSNLTSSIEYSVTSFPKSGSLKPYKLLSTGSISSSIWYNYTLTNAEEYDNYNQNILTNTIPTFIRDDGNNNPYLTFVDMIGHYFDNIWIYLDAITDINLANNNLEKGVSKDLVYTVLQSLGTKLYNKYGDSENDLFLIGQDSGSVNFDNNFTPTGSYLNNIPRKDLLAETYKRIYHNLPLLMKAKGTTYGLQTLISTFGITGSILNVKEYGGDIKEGILNEYNTDKIRIVSNNIYTGSILSPNISVQTYPSSSTQFRTNDLHYVDISFSPETQIDTYASASIAVANPTWNIDDYIGDPSYLYSSSYVSLDTERNIYYNFTSSYMDYAGFIRLIQFFDNSLFKMIKDFVPARTNLSTGITISSPILERNKFVYANPSSTSEIEVNEGSIEGPTIGTEYTDMYQNLTGSKAAYYTGEFEGDVVNYNDIFNETNFNPYLDYNIASWNASYPSNSININSFVHSEFNILLNNVSSSRLSTNRKLVEAIYTMNSPLRLAGYSSSYYAELQDSYESLETHQLSRYKGVKIFSLKYNNYTSASLVYGGDVSFGKEAVINKNTRKLGLFTEIVSSSFLPGRNRISLKYLVDDKGGLIELNQRNKHWCEVQRTFVAGDYLNVSQFDNQKYSNQKTTDGDKLIFDSGYTYYPILYFASCSGSEGTDPKIYFENLSGLNSYGANAVNGSASYAPYIQGGTPIGYPISNATSNGVVTNIFDSVIDGNAYLVGGTLSTYPTYTVTEEGQYRIKASFTMEITIPDNNEATWSLQVYKNSSILIAEDEKIIDSSTSNTWFPVRIRVSNDYNTVCSSITTSLVFISSVYSGLQDGITIYKNKALTIPFTDYLYVADDSGGGYIYEVTSGILTQQIDAC
jgi:hypothetical protein